jgi:hypothetical protein
MRIYSFFTFIICLKVVFGQTKTVALYVEKGKNGKFGLVDMEKVVHVPFKYDAINKERCNYSDRYYFMTKLDSLFGMIDLKGKIIKEPFYDTIKLMSQARDWIITEKDSLIGLIEFIKSNDENNGSLRELIKPLYEKIHYPAGEGMATGFIHIFKDGKMGLVNEKTAKEITGMRYDKVDDYYVYGTLNYITASENGKWGVLDLFGNKIIPCKYDEIIDMEGEYDRLDYVEVLLGEKSFKINRLGKEIN